MPPVPRPSGPQRPASKPAHKAPLGRANSLNLSKIELDAVLDSLEGDSNAAPDPKRQAARMAFRENSVHLEISQPGGQTRINVACRNLSRTGLGFLHSAYLHVGAEVVATLPHRTLGKVEVRGQIVRCRHVRRNIHDVGVQFKKPLNLRDFLELDTLAQAFSCERVDPTQLKGVLLIVSEYKIEQGCIQSMLRGTTIEFRSGSNIASGVAEACKGCDVIICDDAFDDGTGAEFIRKARQSGVRCPIVIMSADKSAEARSRLRAANASGFLEKPVKQDVLLRAMAEFLILAGSGSQESNPLSTTLPHDSPLAALAEEFVDDIHASAEAIAKLAKAGDAPGLRKRVLRIAGSAPALGFEPIAKLCNALIAQVDASKSLSDTVVQINTFVATCRSVRKQPPPASAADTTEAIDDSELEDAVDDHAAPAPHKPKPAAAPAPPAPKSKAA